MTRPYVTALIDTYNHERFVEQAILSVLEQEVGAREMEVLVVDDGSTDGTAAVVQKFVPRVRYLCKPNGGQASAFNAAIPEARGDIIAFLDGDDWWAKEKLRTVLPVFDDREVGMVGHGIYETDIEGKLLRSVVPDRTYRLHARTVEGARQFVQLKAFFGTSRVAYRKSLLDRIPPVPEGICIEADEFLWTMGIAQADAVALEQPLFYYRFHGQNLYMVAEADETRERRKLQSFASLLCHLPARLEHVGVAPEISIALLEPLRVEADLLRLSLDGGTPWEMFCSERAAYRLAYRDAPLGYRLFKSLALGLTLVMAPRAFCRLKRWYARTSLRKWRRLAGEPKDAAPILQQPVGENEQGRRC